MFFVREERLGGLLVRMTGGPDGSGGGDGPVVVLLHGFGAPGDDLVPLWQVIGAPPGTRFIFPVGPLSFQMGLGESRAWWMIDMERLNRDIAAGRLRDLSRDIPPGLEEARDRIVAFLDDLECRFGVGPRNIVLGGFSQGAMLACDVTLRTDRPFLGLTLLSGTLLAKEEWVPLMPKRRGLRVFQSHGSEDPLLPISLAEQLRDCLLEAGLTVEWVRFEGGHEIPSVVTQRLGRFLGQVIVRLQNSHGV